ncbi:Sip1-related alpha-galactosidase [Acidianus manzaensis]|uniref:Raffinose synthase n=1 Tax=Acidianus manzaensis TaxID=282676 RepID=A0A1W6JYU9_9CREN|nr:Sip1-related alpha-galactosidase [Acidianus manzaensis]ARM75438.1 hypothetical protein B6F84_04940 [Acidianus manzaensis]
MNILLDKIFVKNDIIPKLMYSTKNYQEYDVFNTRIYIDHGIGISSEASFTKAEIKLEPYETFLGLTILPIVNYDKAYTYFPQMYAFDRSDVNEPNIKYPFFRNVKDLNELNSLYPCWAYPYTSKDSKNVAYYTTALLTKREDKYYTYLVASNNGVLASLKDNLTLVLEGKYNPDKIAWVLFIGESDDPYASIRNSFESMASKLPVKLRETKRKPRIIGKLGWCSWNAFLTTLDSEKVTNTVRKIEEKGIRFGFIIIDDGYQKLDENKALSSIFDPAKFPSGFPEFNELGIWHTINIYWNGYTEEFKKELKEGLKTGNTYVPPEDLEKGLKAFNTFHRNLKKVAKTLSFIKVDNQWSVRKFYSYPENVILAVQLSAYLEDLEVLSCMSMTPECYTNYFYSNIMRTSNDYLPNSKTGTKLHILFNAYNSLFFNNIVYPDYDMFSSYDIDALPHLVSRIFSGGPVYITDRDPERTNISLLKKIIIKDSITTVDYPAIITKDLIFKNPYEEDVLLKLASKANNIPVIAFFNVNKDSKKIKDTITLKDLPYHVSEESLMYYKVIAEEYGNFSDLKVELDENQAEIVILAKKGTKIGLKEFLLPPATMKDETPLTSGTLIILDDPIKEVQVNL